MRVLVFFTARNGLGSNPIGIDRGAGGGLTSPRFDRNGDRVLVVFENWNYRSSATDESRRASDGRRSRFRRARSPRCRCSPRKDGGSLVDATDFVIRDWNDIGGTLAAKQRRHLRGGARSIEHRPRRTRRHFPRTREIDVALTFVDAGTARGRQCRRSCPTAARSRCASTSRSCSCPTTATVRACSIRALDSSASRSRTTRSRFRARSSSAGSRATGSSASNPNDPNSAFRQEPDHLLHRSRHSRAAAHGDDGGRCGSGRRRSTRPDFAADFASRCCRRAPIRWTRATTPCMWVNRNERGWSFGGSHGDPRTGEIIKGVAHMDSHRNRTDYNIYAALVGAAPAAADTAFVLARIRQVTAHEIGHTIGMAHNYIASTYERGSVMDYPAPRVRLERRTARSTSRQPRTQSGPGEYDMLGDSLGVRHLSRRRPSAIRSRRSCAKVCDKGYLFLSDADARPGLRVRPAHESLGRRRDASGVPPSPDGRSPRRDGAVRRGEHSRPASRSRCFRSASRRSTSSIASRSIRLDEGRSAGWSTATRSRAMGSRRRGPIDACPSAAGARRLSSRALSANGARDSRYGPHAARRRGRSRIGAVGRAVRHAHAPGVRRARRGAHAGADDRGRSSAARARGAIGAVCDSRIEVAHAGRDDRFAHVLVDRCARARPRRPMLCRRVSQRAVADRLLLLAADKEAAPDVRAIVELKMDGLRRRARSLAASGSVPERAHWLAIAADFTRWLERRELPTPTPAMRAPPGDPFGMER